MSDNFSLSEEELFRRTVAAFKYYRTQMMNRATKSINYYNSFSDNHKKLIPDFLDNMKQVMRCIDTNAKVIELFAIYQNGSEIFTKDPTDLNSNYEQIKEEALDAESESLNAKKMSVRLNDLDKVRSTLKQFVRDWSSEGALERQLCYQPVINEIVSLYNINKCSSRKDYKILVPGSGLGRLAWEIARLGFTCQGNEWSLYMLLPSYYILNNCTEANAFKLYPWLSNYCNNCTREDQLASISFPDVNPTDIPSDSNFSMAAGDFVEIYTEPNNWDCIATVFFIDTSHNILSYIDTIWNILKPGGHWINLGPLLFHYADIPNEDSIELSYDELKKAITLKGFKFISKRYPVEVSYTQDKNSMLNYQYKCVYFVVQKPQSNISISNMGDILI